MGYWFATSSSRPSYSALAKLVLITAGETALTRTFGPSSAARVLVRCETAALLTPYQPMPGAGISDETDDKFKTRPLRSSNPRRSSFKTLWTQARVLRTLTL